MKKDEIEIPDIRRRDVSVPLACKSCIFFRRHATYPKPCQELGTIPSAKICNRFVPDPFQMDEFENLRRLLACLVRTRYPSLAYAAVLGSVRIKKMGFNLGQEVFFKVIGGEFLGNYARGVIVGATVDGKVIVAGAESFSAVLSPRSVVDAEGFAKKKKRLVTAGKINDPDVRLERIRIRDKALLLAHIPKFAGTKKKRGRPRTKTPSKGPIVIGR